MKIGELGQATGFTDKTIRYYERQGVLPAPERTSSGYRKYGPEDIDRLVFIRKAKRLGLSLEDIKGILQVHDRREATCLHVRSLLGEKLAQVDAVLKDLQTFREELAAIQERANALDPPVAASAGSSRTPRSVPVRRPCSGSAPVPSSEASRRRTP